MRRERVRRSSARTGVLFSFYLNNSPHPPQQRRAPEETPSFTYLFLILLKDTQCFAALAFCPPTLARWRSYLFS